MFSLRHTLMGGAAVCAVSIAATPAFAEVQSFDIPAQPARTAIQEFGRQSGLQILASQTDVGDQKVQALKGEYEPREALRRLLVATNLRVASDDGRTVTLAPQSGSAAGDGADSGTVQALIVTAQKREENIQDVPIAMSAFSQEDLTRSQVAGGPDLMTQVPNFTFTKTNFSSYSIQIRGIGTQAISATTDAAVAVAFNNTPFIRNRFFEQEFYDLQRVEVLRGPQGTLYGRNATAGVVNIISAKPSFHQEARLSADVSNYNSHRLEGMINLPLVDDKVALRVAGAWTKRDGYDTNQITGNQIDGRDLWSTRVSLRLEPTDYLHANLIWEHFHEDDDRLRSGKQLCNQDNRSEIQGYGVRHPTTLLYGDLFSQGCLPASLYSPDSFQAPNGYAVPYYAALSILGLPLPAGTPNPYVSLVQSHDLRVIESTVDPIYRANSDVIELQFRVDLGRDLTLTSEMGYNYDRVSSLEDYNRFNTAPGAFANADQLGGYDPGRPGVIQQGPVGGIFCDPQLGCADRLVAVDLSTARSRQFSQEFRLSSNFDGPFNFSLGANYLRNDSEDKYYVFINTLTLAAARHGYGDQVDLLQPYVPGVTDNHECLPQGGVDPDPTIPQHVGRCVYIDPNPIGSLNDLGHNYFLSKNPYKLFSYAIFGEAYYNIAENLKLTAGLRWTVDKKQAPRIPSWVEVGYSLGYPVIEVVKQEWREPTGRLNIDWKPHLSFTDETLLYASYAHGYKAGGANPPRNGVAYWGDPQFAQALITESATKPKTFDPEFVNAYEIGSKNTLLDGRLTMNGSAFFYDYTGYQISQIIDRSAVNYNFDAKVWGAELEADWRPLENLRLGLKVGYEKTRVANGEHAIDIMDRTAGMPGWVVAKPFPSFPSNCILPLSVVNGGNDPTFTTLEPPQGMFQNGEMGPCEYAYALHVDPRTLQPYTPYPFGPNNPYPGFDPTQPAINNGEGFAKDLSGHELPNAPHYTVTVTADYTVPLPNDWLMTLHGDFYEQSEAWTRIFNTPGYDKLKAYNNVNLAAIFSNEDAGWKVMAYVKNVFDKDNITGAFLNSDDSGLTTNVFLNEPRLYGLRVTKEWTGTKWWTGANPNHTPGEAYPFTVELGGSLPRLDGDYDPVESAGPFTGAIDRATAENRDLDRGEGGDIRLTYKSTGGVWSLSGGFRYGKAKGLDKLNASKLGDSGCRFGPPFDFLCPNEGNIYNAIDWARGTVANHERYELADFSVGRDVGLGVVHSTWNAGLRYAAFESTTRLDMTGVPDWQLQHGATLNTYNIHDYYDTDLTAKRTFEGFGPMLSIDLSKQLVGNAEEGHLDVDAAISGGVLFGRQKAMVQGSEFVTRYGGKYASTPQPILMPAAPTEHPGPRSKSATVSTFGASLGFSYEVQRMKLSTGYRWERYYNVLDAGYTGRKQYDRTIDGPYLKIAVGFGG